jgi:hypothetical protein
VTCPVRDRCRANEGGRNGIGVFQLTRKTRKINTLHQGFIGCSGR